MWFNYLWMVILVMCIVGFILHTLLSFYSDYKRVLRADAYADWYSDPNVKKEISEERIKMPFYKILPLAYREFKWQHDKLHLVWKFIFVVIIVLIFAVSLAFWLNSLHIEVVE